jgi:hypothetical protein
MIHYAHIESLDISKVHVAAEAEKHLTVVGKQAKDSTTRYREAYTGQFHLDSCLRFTA